VEAEVFGKCDDSITAIRKKLDQLDVFKEYEDRDLDEFKSAS
jgi:hypothetical protein